MNKVRQARQHAVEEQYRVIRILLMVFLAFNYLTLSFSRFWYPAEMFSRSEALFRVVAGSCIVFAMHIYLSILNIRRMRAGLTAARFAPELLRDLDIVAVLCMLFAAPVNEGAFLFERFAFPIDILGFCLPDIVVLLSARDRKQLFQRRAHADISRRLFISLVVHGILCLRICWYDMRNINALDPLIRDAMLAWMTLSFFVRGCLVMGLPWNKKGLYFSILLAVLMLWSQATNWFPGNGSFMPDMTFASFCCVAVTIVLFAIGMMRGKYKNQANDKSRKMGERGRIIE